MPRKFITPEVKDQNRECQRRSRARRKEMVDNLKKQLETYQKQGVSASLEMQRAARSVSIENQRLRKLLLQLGVTPAALHAYLSTPEASSHAMPVGLGPPTLTPSGGTKLPVPESSTEPFTSTGYRIPEPIPTTPDVALPSPAPSLGCNVGQSTAASNAALTATSFPPSPLRSNTGSVERRGKEMASDTQLPSTVHIPCRSAQTFDSATEHHDVSLSNAFPPVSDCFCPQDPSSSYIDQADNMETSCETAAAILVEVQGYADYEQARSALGCVGGSPCNVKNTRIFHLMEKLS